MATVEQMEKKRSRQIVEILAAVKMLAAEVAELRADIGQQTKLASKAIGSMADEMVNLKTEIAELQSSTAPPPVTTRRTKK